MKKFPTLFKKTASGKTQIWKIKVEEGNNGEANMITIYGLEDGKPQVKVEKIRAGKNIGKKNETTPYKQACAEAQGRWNKQKDRKGYGLTVEESADIRAASPMLAHVYSKHSKKVDWSSAWAQPKLDGFRCLIRIERKGNVRLTSRENQSFYALDDIREAAYQIAENREYWKELRLFAEMDEITIDGELYCHGMSLNDIASACKKKSGKTKQLKYYAFDVLLDETFTNRINLVKLFAKHASSELVVPVDTVKVRSETDLMVCQSTFIDAGYEGAMLRWSNKGYEAGKRSSNLLKVKTFEDDEFEVIDYKMGRGTYEGVPIFICITKDNNLFDVTAPGNMEEKRALGRTAKQYVGRMLTVKYQYLTKTEDPVPFLPVALRFRE